MQKTKIVCTMGPATADYNTIVKLIKGGMNVARLNMSHGELDGHRQLADLIKKARKQLNIPCAIMVDTRGPEIRIGSFKNGSAELKHGQTFTFTTREVEGDNSIVSLREKHIINSAHPGKLIYADSGLIIFKIKQVTATDIVCKVIEGGLLGSNKNFAIPHAKLNIPYISEVDKTHIKFAAEIHAEYIACSFVSSAEDVDEVRSLVKQYGGECDLIAKIESSAGIKNLKSIMQVSDGIMVARGDMGTEVPLSHIPSIQKQMLKDGLIAGKPIIVATEMLETMTENPRPTRAEVTDVANAIFDRTNATMLSGETAVGKHPLTVVNTMSKIAADTENAINYEEKFRQHYNFDNNSLNAVSYSAVGASFALNAKVIVCFTKTGRTARWLSRYRPKAAILAVTHNEQVYNKLALIWGVKPILRPVSKNMDTVFDDAESLAKAYKLAKAGDTIIITSGTPSVNMGPTNLIKVSVIK